MSEIAEQIQDSIPTGTPATEVPAPSLPKVPSQAPNPERPQPDGATQDEVALSVEIVQLWQMHQDSQSAIKQETHQFRSLRSELGRLLHQMKVLLAKPGPRMLRQSFRAPVWLAPRGWIAQTEARLVAQ